MAELPTGTVTFLFTDIEGSTRLWQESSAAMQVAVARHDELLRSAIEGHDGVVFSTSGDGMAAAFQAASSAVAGALEAQRNLREEEWPPEAPIRVRMGLHTGEAQQREGDYFGTPLNRTARLMEVGHGGEVLCSAATAALVEAEVPLIDLGEHRLRDLDRPLRVFQLGEGDFPPLRSLDAFPGNLPLQVSSFIGRDRELTRVTKALDEARVVTLTGVGGVGKTRLALQVAAEVLPRFQEGAWLVDLASVRDPDGVVDAAALVFGVTARGGMTLGESLVEVLRTKRLLLVIDNCEHLLEAVAEVVEGIEQSCPGVVVLATSREGLGLDGEKILAVVSLGAPARGATFEEILRADAVTLFVDRAQQVEDDFVLSSENANSVLQICRRLDGVPLAIELAAARITTMNPAELASALDRRLEVLSGGRRRAIKRHQTLRATIDWSYELLSEPQRRLLARLSVFTGGCTREAAEEVCGTEPLNPRKVFELLSDLVAQSLVVADREGPETRYRLLETVREYAEERLVEHDEVTALRDRHLDCYSAFVDRHLDHVFGPEQVLWGNRVLADRDNIYSAWLWAIDSDNFEAAFGISLCELPAVQIGYQLTLSHELLLDLTGATGHPDYPYLLARCAAFAVGRGDFGRVEALSARALEADTDRDPRVEWYLTTAEGLLAIARGEYAEAARSFERGVDAMRRAGLPGAYISLQLAHTAALRTSAGDPGGAVPLAEEALSIARSTGMPTAIAGALLALGVAVADTNPAEARACLEESLEIGGALGYEQVGELTGAVHLASRLHDRRATLDLAGRAIRHLQWTSGQAGIVIMFDFVSAALRSTRPDAAVVIRGASEAIQRRARDSSTDPAPTTRHSLDPNDPDTLWARGAAMNVDDACTYALAEIQAYLDTDAPGPT